MEVKPVLFNYNTYCGYGVEFENYSKYKYIMIARAYFLSNNKKIALTSDKPLYVLRWLLGFPAKFHIHVLRCSHNTCCCRFQWNNFHDSCRMFLNTENEHFIFKYFHNLQTIVGTFQSYWIVLPSEQIPIQMDNALVSIS